MGVPQSPPTVDKKFHRELEKSIINHNNCSIHIIVVKIGIKKPIKPIVLQLKVVIF